MNKNENILLSFLCVYACVVSGGSCLHVACEVMLLFMFVSCMHGRLDPALLDISSGCFGVYCSHSLSTGTCVQFIGDVVNIIFISGLFRGLSVYLGQRFFSLATSAHLTIKTAASLVDNYKIATA